MPFKFGSNSGNKIYKGTTEIKQVYVGETLSYTARTPITAFYMGGDGALYKYDLNGNLIWEVPTSSNDEIYDLTVGINGNIYVVDTGADLHVFDPDGNLVFEVLNFGGSFQNEKRSVAVDFDGNIYTGSEKGIVDKFDGNGNHLFSYNPFGRDIDAMAVDTDNNIYLGTDDQLGLHKYDKNGNFIWKVESPFNSIESIYVSSLNRVYVGDRNSGLVVLDFDGNISYSVPPNIPQDDLAEIAINQNGVAYTIYQQKYMQKISPSGNKIWEINLPQRPFSLTTDYDGNVYVSYIQDPPSFVEKYDSNGNFVWSDSFSIELVRDMEVDIFLPLQ